MESENVWWAYNRKDLFQKLSSTEIGLTQKTAEKKIIEYGLNSAENYSKTKSLLKVIANQFNNWLTIVLLIASGLSLYLGEGFDAVVIISLVILSGFFGFIQEFKAENAVEKIKNFLTHNCRVMRDGKWTMIENKYLVPGDIISLRIGDKVSADIRLLESNLLTVDESVLTGESIPVEKSDSEIGRGILAITDQHNMLFMGTTVISGNGTGIVVSTGTHTNFGKSQKVFSEKQSENDFQVQIRSFSQFLFKVIVLMTVAIFLINAILAKDIVESFLFALALAIGITPEMLPAIITVTLSQGAMRMAKKKVIVKRLASVEDFGNMDTLCMDKTGTLTEGKFSLIAAMGISGKNDEGLIKKALICTSKFAQNSNELVYDPHDEAIWESVYAHKYIKKLTGVKFINENVFDYERRRMSVCYAEDGKNFLVVKGSPESIVNQSDRIIVGQHTHKLDKRYKRTITNKIEEYEAKAYRVLGIAQRPISSGKSSKSDEENLVFLGFLLFKDPIKESARETINKFENLGIALKIISGDSMAVSVNIARETGLDFLDSEVIGGDELEKLSPEEFSIACRDKKLFTRITPIQKYKIIRSLNYEGHVVGFLGDGINDVGALREADVGISVDTGADIAKDASDIILLKKDLNVLTDGIIAGRRTFGNIMKYILNTISANYGNMFTVAISSFFLKFIPLLPTQILLNNFVSDIPLFAVATDNVDNNFLRKPKKWNIGYIQQFMIYYGFVSTFFDLLLILPMVFILKVDPAVFRTAWFIESSISEILVTFAIRTKLPFYQSKPSSLLVLLSLLSVGFIVSMSFLEISIFEFTQLPAAVWSLILFDLVSYFTVTEIAKRGFFAKFEN